MLWSAYGRMEFLVWFSRDYVHCNLIFVRPYFWDASLSSSLAHCIHFSHIFPASTETWMVLCDMARIIRQSEYFWQYARIPLFSCQLYLLFWCYETITFQWKKLAHWQLYWRSIVILGKWSMCSERSICRGSEIVIKVVLISTMSKRSSGTFAIFTWLAILYEHCHGGIRFRSNFSSFE